jgi:hypothetical protein
VVDNPMNQQKRYLAYLLRLWQEGGGSPPGDPPIWRASLETPQSHELQAFAGLDELVAFVREQMHGAPSRSGDAAEDGALCAPVHT